MSPTVFVGCRASRRAWEAAKRREMKRGRVVIMQIEHDDFCKVFEPQGYCGCNPTRVLKDSFGHVLASVENAGSYDLRAYLLGGAHE